MKKQYGMLKKVILKVMGNHNIYVKSRKKEMRGKNPEYVKNVKV